MQSKVKCNEDSYLDIHVRLTWREKTVKSHVFSSMNANTRMLFYELFSAQRNHFTDTYFLHTRCCLLHSHKLLVTRDVRMTPTTNGPANAFFSPTPTGIFRRHLLHTRRHTYRRHDNRGRN
jgi:hypothetical protein